MVKNDRVIIRVLIETEDSRIDNEYDVTEDASSNNFDMLINMTIDSFIGLSYGQDVILNAFIDKVFERDSNLYKEIKKEILDNLNEGE